MAANVPIKLPLILLTFIPNHAHATPKSAPPTNPQNAPTKSPRRLPALSSQVQKLIPRNVKYITSMIEPNAIPVTMVSTSVSEVVSEDSSAGFRSADWRLVGADLTGVSAGLGCSAASHSCADCQRSRRATHMALSMVARNSCEKRLFSSARPASGRWSSSSRREMASCGTSPVIRR